MPPDLGANSVALVNGSTFLLSAPNGDVPSGSIGGLVHLDTRLLSRWVLRINGTPLLALRSDTVDTYSAQFFVTNPPLPGVREDTVAARRLRYLGDGLHERIEITCYCQEPLRIEVRLETGTDFADIMEIKSVVLDRSDRIRRQHAPDGSRLVFTYEHEGFSSQTVISASPAPQRLDGDDLVWAVELAPHSTWSVDLHIPLPAGTEMPNRVSGDISDVFHHRVEDPSARWEAQVSRLSSEQPLLERVLARSRADLVAMRMEMEIHGEWVSLPAAGLPWFLTLFGRDTLITAYQSLASGPRLAKGALLALARLQGTRCDDFSDEEPGKILHEVRSGELTRRGVKPYDPYYGAADSTQLWLILLSEYWRWTGDDDLVRSLRDNAMAALAWIDTYGDRDGDGYVEYATHSTEGLGNQCWRDSWDGIRFADGAMPVLPIATCEIQGYTYDAKLRLAELADGPLADPGLARRLRAAAAELRARFDRDFWIDERGGFYAVGLDGDKNCIDSMTSNMGHLLWSGIVPPQRVDTVARQLLSPQMFSGWGIRTLCTDDRPYNPIGYHLGTVWPHDTSLAVLGLCRYGFRDEANTLALALLDAAAQFDYRLPEALAGYPRHQTTFAVPYPTACSPQAWASGAPLVLARAILGLEPIDGRITLDPHIPESIGRITVARLNAFGRFWDVEATGGRGAVRPSDR
ncbi:Glycogen debranching enzyme (alpha-1,6-glucosidase) [Micromonospora purpureochromogenes]|uniref:Glycogen debranching enzyme (Alpha-1,6-glucosidase) n=2 Tax=Micromonospora purpureochromogenes TaxID=47872 RepID=A0A1C4XND0_9ACTN|nr:Glycogen debranching enzyme (alpha-1,6-glucosidase) [Micromonospora purpureochromogenes]